jgi:hypothetical protein
MPVTCQTEFFLGIKGIKPDFKLIKPEGSTSAHAAAYSFAKRTNEMKINKSTSKGYIKDI